MSDDGRTWSRERRTVEAERGLTGWVIALTVALAVLHVALLAVSPIGKVVVSLPWFLPTIDAFATMAGLAVAFLCLGRYQVLRDSASLWAGVAFAASAVFCFYHLLAWPGLLGDRALITQNANTSGWYGNLIWTALALVPLAALFAPSSRRAEQGWRWAWYVLAGVGLVVVLCGLAIAFERSLPVLVDSSGAFTAFNNAWQVAISLPVLVGTLLCVRRYRQTDDRLLAYLTFAGVLLSFAIVPGILGGARYDVLWYMRRFLLLGSLSLVLFGLLTDYVHLFRSEQERTRDLEESEERFRTLANNISQLAWMADEKGRIFWYNQRWFDYTGTTLEEMEGWGWQKIHHPAHVKRVEEKISRSFRMGEEWEDTFPLRGKDGRYRWFLSRAIPIHDEQGKVVRWFGTNTDITERLEIEQQREKLLVAEHEARVLAEKAARARDEYIAVVSHEIRTPLTTIKGFAQMLVRQLERGGDVDKERLAKAAQTTWIESERLSTLAGRLVTASDLETGDLKLIRKETELSALVEKVVSKAKRIYPNRAIRLSEDGSVPMWVDPPRLSQVFAGLIENAVKFSPTDSPIEVNVGGDGGGGAVISVRDYGSGIPEAERERIFERYYRALPYRQYGGVGLGLYLAKRIVEMHGGTVSVGQPEEGGSRFTIHIPPGGEE